MIILKVRNGLGNQMFIYALGKYLEKKYGQEILFDLSGLQYSNTNRKTYDIETIFEGTYKKATSHEIRKYTGRILYINATNVKSKFIKSLLYRLNSIHYKNKKVLLINEPNYWDVGNDFVTGFIDYKFEKDRIYYISGFWENLAYINSIGLTPNSIFSFKNKSFDDNIYYKDIICTNSVAIHVRRGDFLTESNKVDYPKNLYNVCNEDYYNAAINIMKLKVENPLFFFFTDDPDYVNEKFSRINKVIVIGNRDYIDMQLISLCKHVILANSTFSLWGALLNNNKGVVIAPSVHYIHMESDKDIYINKFFNVDDWIYIDNNFTQQEGKIICH